MIIKGFYSFMIIKGFYSFMIIKGQRPRSAANEHSEVSLPGFARRANTQKPARNTC